MSWEFVIDTIREWLLAQGYTTEAWVEAKLYLQKAEYPGYGMPINLTGDPDPDCTCTYFRCGDLNGKPCYSQEDGSYFLWWNNDTRWVISTALGLPVGRWGYRQDPDVLGAYVHFPHTTGDAIAASGYKYLSTSFIDRGDPATNDWDEGDLTLNWMWHDLDCSAIVPAGAKSILFALAIVDNAVNKNFYLRRKGNTQTINISQLTTQVTNIWKRSDLVCPCDDNRFVQYFSSQTGAGQVRLAVKGWWF